jgi:hypothetical protein
MRKTFNPQNMILTAFSTMAFDAASLLSAEMDTSELEINRVLIPEGEWIYRIGKPKISSGQKDGRDWAQLNLPLECVDQDILTELNVEKIGTRNQFFLDLDENGRLAKGTNVNINLGRAFKAAGLHGEMASIANLEGRLIRGNTKQRRSDSGAEYNDVVAMTSSEE